MLIKIPYCPRHPQTEIHPQLDSHRFNVLVAHRRMGKSVLCINHTIKKAIQNKLGSPRYAFIAPYLKQAKMIAWDFLKRFSAPIPGIQINESELSVELPNKAKIWLIGADNPEAIRGTYFDGVVLDEYAQIKPWVFNEIVRPTLVDRNGWCIFGGTPRGQNQFLEIYQTAQKKVAAGDQDWWHGIYRADETNVIPVDELVQLKATLSDKIYRQEFLCSFEASTDNVLIPIDLVSSACDKNVMEYDVRDFPVIIGVDPARFGDDKSVIAIRQGQLLRAILPISKVDNMTLAGMVADKIVKYKADAVFIDAGRGEGVIDRLRQLSHEVQEINFGGKPSSGMYANKRAEIWDKMREWLEQGGALPPGNQDLKADLSSPSYDFDASNKMRLESKEEIKERLGRSPDMADALALTFSVSVVRKKQNRMDDPDLGYKLSSMTARRQP